MEEYDFDDEADLMVLSDAPSFVPLPGGPVVKTPAEVDSPTSVASASPSNVHVAQSPNWVFCQNLNGVGLEAWQKSSGGGHQC